MTLITDLITNGVSFTPSDKQKLERLKARIGDPTIEAAFQRVNAVHTIFQYATDPTGGTFTLTITLRDSKGRPVTFTTAGIAYNANAATIEGAIDTAATGVVTGWTDGDISVSGGTLLAAGADVLLTFDGASVAGEHSLTTIDGSSLTGGSLADPATEITTAGQTIRRARALLTQLDVIANGSAPPAQTAQAAITAGLNRLNIHPELIRQLVQEVAAEDANSDAINFILDVVIDPEHRKVPI